jgi:hypothetical protein
MRDDILDLGVMDDAELMRHAIIADDAHCAIARSDVNAFATYVLRDEETKQPIEQAPHHESWHDLIAQHPRLVILSHRDAGKTQQISIAYVLWRLGNNPNLRIAILSDTAGQAEKIIGTLARYIEASEHEASQALHRVFPDLRPSKRKADKWTGSALFVDRTVLSKDPSVQACGVHGNVTGSRIDLLIIDDILDYENTRTEHLRDDVWAWYHSTIVGCLTPRKSQVIAIGTAYHPKDFLHRLAGEKSWPAYRYPIVDDEGNSRWPERWSDEAIALRRQELTPIEFARAYLCIARDDASARCKVEWIDRCKANGEGRSQAYALTSVPPGYRVFTGVDLAISQASSADLTALFTLCIHPNGHREVLDVTSGRWQVDEIVNRIVDIHNRYQGIVIVESNQAQMWMTQLVSRYSSVPVKPFTTGKNKHSPEFGVESIFAELAAGQWIIPNQKGQCHPEINAWMSEMLYYDPNGHTGDRLMAAWFAREGSRLQTAVPQRAHLDLLRR